MALAETANLMVKLSLGGNFTSQIGKAGAAIGKFEGKTNRAYKAGQQIGTGIKRGAVIAAAGVGLLATQVAVGLQSLIKLEQAQAQTNAVLRSTKGIAAITGREVTRLSEKYEGLNAIIGDEFIRAGQNMLLTFTNIRGKAFEPALLAVLNLNTAMGKGPEGLTKTAILVGKALNDPAKGLTALTRVGVAFSKDQVKRIKALQKEGKTYEAQKIILAELNKEFGGSFLAQGQTTAGKVAKFGDAIEDLQRSLAVALLPTVSNVADALTALLADPATIKGAADIGKAIGEVFSAQNIKTGAAAVGDAFKVVQGAMPAIKAGLQGVASLVGGAVTAFRSLPPEIQALAVGGFALNKLTGGLVTNVGGGLIGAVLGKLRSAVVNVQGGVVNVAGGVGGAGAGAAGAGSKVGGAVTKALSLAAVVGAAFAVFETQQQVSGASSAQAQGVKDTATVFLAQSPTTAALQNSLAGVDKGIADLQSNPLFVLVQGDALEQLRETKAAIERQLTERQKDADSSVTATKTGTTTVQAGLTKVQAQALLTAAAVKNADSNITAGTASTVGATNSAASSITAAIRASTPTIINNISISATSITKVTQVTKRYGSTTTSRDGHAEGHGPLP